MRVCLIGDFAGDPDEGMKNVARYYARRLSEQDVVVRKLHVGDVFSFNFFESIVTFDPDIVHYIPGIGWRNIVLTRLLMALSGAETVISAIHPDVTALPDTLVRSIGPSMVFTQDTTLAKSLSECGIEVTRLPNGVDLHRFRPLPEEERRGIREDFGLPTDKFLALHVGHITQDRNLGPLLRLQRSGIQVVVVSSDHFDTNGTLANRLHNAGVMTIDGYIKDIERLYAATDCYVFPTTQGDTIQMPLSVLEAMACDTPVVTAEHPGLIQWFDEGEGLFFTDTNEELVAEVDRVRRESPQCETRRKAEQYSWDAIVKNAVNEYRTLLK